MRATVGVRNNQFGGEPTARNVRLSAGRVGDHDLAT
jgi:hypothetical protein